MKAVIVEIKNNIAIALSDDGCVTKVKNNSYTIGQVIKLKSRNKNRIAALAATAASLAIVSGIGAWAYISPYSYVSLDVNPSIEYTVNRFDRVLSVNGVNEDGQSILNEIDADTLKNQTIDDAIVETIDQISEKGYFDGEESGGLVITASSDDQTAADELAADLKVTAELEALENGDVVEVEAEGVGYERVQQAKELGVTPGKLNLVEKMRDSSADPENINIEEWLNKSVKDIMKATKENREAAKTQEEAIVDNTDEQPTTDSTNTETSSDVISTESTENKTLNSSSNKPSDKSPNESQTKKSSNSSDGASNSTDKSSNADKSSKSENAQKAENKGKNTPKSE